MKFIFFSCKKLIFSVHSPATDLKNGFLEGKRYFHIDVCYLEITLLNGYIVIPAGRQAGCCLSTFSE